MKKHQHNWIWWVDPQTGDEFWTCTECHEVESPNYTTNMIKSFMTIKEIIKQLETLRWALEHARSPEEAISIQFEINRLENLSTN